MPETEQTDLPNKAVKTPKKNTNRGSTDYCEIEELLKEASPAATALLLQVVKQERTDGFSQNWTFIDQCVRRMGKVNSCML